MSSFDRHSDEDAKRSKKRRIQRACDNCRRKKVRCDAAEALLKGDTCSNCASSGADCTFSNESTMHGQSRAHVKALEGRIKYLEDLLRKLATRFDIEAEVAQKLSNFPSGSSPLYPVPGHSDPSHSSSVRQTSNSDLIFPRPLGNNGTSSNVRNEYAVDSRSDSSEEEDELPLRITRTLQELNMNECGGSYHGRSSGLQFLRAAAVLRRKQGIQQSPDLEDGPVVPSEWQQKLMETPSPEVFTFPPDELARVLFDLFFTHFTPFFPIIHRPTFEAQYGSGLHLNNLSFAKCVMLVYAIASRYCDDPRVCLQDIGRQSAGWPYFTQVGDLKRAPHVPATLHDIQCYVMLAYFLETTFARNSAWTVIGNGIRAAQDVGMNLKKPSKGPITLDDEFQKRSFWCLIVMDRYMGVVLGRSLACQDEDIDLDLPVEIDDEYWSSMTSDGSPGPAPCQPNGVPSRVSFFGAAVRLNPIVASAMRKLFSVNKSTASFDPKDEQWYQAIISDLDSRLKDWIDNIPEHLKWDPNRENEIHFVQSATLYASYYTWRSIIHRPFVHPTKVPSPISFDPVLASTSAARSCSRVLEALQKRGIRAPSPLLSAAINSGTVLLMALWKAKREGVSVNSGINMQDVNHCVDFLKAYQEEWHTAKLLLVILEDLASGGELDMSNPPKQMPNLKRSHSQYQDSFATVPLVDPLLAKNEVTFSSGDLTESSEQLDVPPSSVYPARSFAERRPISPATEILRSYLGVLPLEAFGPGLNAYFGAFDPLPSSAIETSFSSSPLLQSPSSGSLLSTYTNVNANPAGTLEWGARTSNNDVDASGLNHTTYPNTSPSAFGLVNSSASTQEFGTSVDLATDEQTLPGGGGGWNADALDWECLLDVE